MSSFEDQQPHDVVKNSEREDRPSRSISTLPLEVVQRIASGEVIPDFQAVIQELVENAIDAYAKNICVSIDFKSCSVTVRDDGVGISAPHDLEQIAGCNATSKLRSLHELEAGVPTLGFRGQGLWAIAAKAKSLVVASRTGDAPHGTSVTFSKAGHPLRDSISAVAMAVGTVVSVHGLPWSLAGRDKSKATQKCKLWLVRAALSHPSVSFKLKRNTALLWQRSYKGGMIAESLIQTLANELKVSPAGFRYGSRSLPVLGSVHVIFGLPSIIHTFSKMWLVTAMNGRHVSFDLLYRALVPEFSVPKGRFPVIFVAVNITPGAVDWNISPIKANVRFKDLETEQSVVDAVISVATDLLQKMPDSAVSHGHNLDLDISSRIPGPVPLLFSTVSTSFHGQLPDASQEGKSIHESIRASIVSSLGRNARVVTQVLGTYILVERDAGILLVEQHVAHERILYEGFLDEWSLSSCVELKTPIQLPCSISEEWIFKLTSMGFNIEQSIDSLSKENKSQNIIRSVPAAFRSLPLSERLPMILKLGSNVGTIEDAAATLACNMAIRNGTALTHGRMTSIIAKLMACRNPHTCPHGRPIFVEMSTAALARSFRRTWTPERVIKLQGGTPPFSSKCWDNGILPE